jgi:DNA-directed RNA polymerase subunit RPC12/RpoP
MQMGSNEPPKQESLRCPSCRRQFADEEVARGRGGRRCPDCGFRLFVAGRLLETEVRRQLYGLRSPVVRVLSAEGRPR